MILAKYLLKFRFGQRLVLGPRDSMPELQDNRELFDTSRSDFNACQIRFVNDDDTTMEFVVESLEKVLKIERQHALRIVLKIHFYGEFDLGRMSKEKAQLYVLRFKERSNQAGCLFQCAVVEARL